MRRRFLLVLSAALLLQGTLFAVYYGDLLFLGRLPADITVEQRDTFVAHAQAALGRSRLTVRHLDAIAGGAEALGLHDVEIAALERRVDGTPDDSSVRLRLADAFRRAGRFADAEAVYLDVLAASGQPHP